MRARHVVDVVQAGTVGRAQLAREVQAQAGALAVGGEEGLEQLALARPPARPGRCRSRSVRRGRAIAAQHDADRAVARRSHSARRCAAGSTSPGAGARGRTRSTASRAVLEHEALARHAPRWRRTRQEVAQPRRCSATARRLTRSRRLSCSTSATRRSRRWVLSWMMRVSRSRSVAALLLAQQLGGVADRRERVADLVRDVGGQAAERGELELLRLLARARRVLDEQHRELLLGARVEQAQAKVAPAQLEVGALRRPPPRAPARASDAAEARRAGRRASTRAEQPLGAEQALRLRVVLHHAALAVEHQPRRRACPRSPAG